MSGTPEAVDMAAFAHARGEPPDISAVIRQQPRDFRVDERCPVRPCGEGEHLWLAVEKTGLTTVQVANWLAEAAHIKRREIGYAGLKDRRAVTTQWFSLPWPIRRGDEMLAVDPTKLPANGSARLHTQCRHSRKLRRGTHSHNAFELTLRHVRGDPDSIENDLTRIVQTGVPNYFGPQRFGHDGRNLDLARALFAGKRLRRDKRSYALSAARSFLFNSVLDARVRARTWNTLLPGEAVMLDGSNSLFSAAGQDVEALNRRLDAFDLHPSGPLPGQSDSELTAEAVQALEDSVVQNYPELVDGLANAGVEAARRTLRLSVPDLDWHWLDADCLQLKFTLPVGGFATAVLRELAIVSEPVSSLSLQAAG